MDNGRQVVYAREKSVVNKPHQGDIQLMRIRPFFWFLLIFSCVGALVFAVKYPVLVPAILQVHVDQQHLDSDLNSELDSDQITCLELHLTDLQGTPIEEAQVLSNAHMTNMDMSTHESTVNIKGHGKYTVRLHLTMAGFWVITIQAQANGFSVEQQTLMIQVR